jgi:hypothetical protein
VFIITSRLARFAKSARLAILLCGLTYLTPLHAGTIELSGIITQATQDGTGPAVNNPGLNNIQDGSQYSFTLNVSETFAAVGTQDLTGASLIFGVPEAGALESSFGFTSLTVANLGDLAEVSIFGCLTTGSGCNQGNELGLNFMIPAADLSAQNVVAQAIPGLLPLDLLEDDGVTDIQGSIATYTGTLTDPVNPVPEPSSIVLAGLGLIALSRIRVRSWAKSRVQGG